MKALSLITIVLVASLSTSLFAQDCNNPLLSTYGLAGLDTPQPGAGLPYCANLQNGQTCCSAETVATFQDIANGLIDRLNNYGAGKDLYLAQLSDRYYDRFNDLLGDLNENYLDDLQRIREANGTIADQLQADIDAATQANNNARDIDNRFDGAFGAYQTARKNCLTAALQVQASAWCSACDPNYATQGVADDGTVTFSNGLCQAISDTCTPYFNEGAQFNPLIAVRQAYWRLMTVSQYMRNYSNTNQVTPYIVLPDPYYALSTQQAVTAPPAWTADAGETGGSGRCTDLWLGDPMLAQLPVLVGSPAPAINDNNEDAEVILFTEEDVIVDTSPENQVIVVDANGGSGARLLQDILAGPQGIWAPDFVSTGLNFDGLRADPGDYFGVGDYSDSFGETQDIDDDNDDTNGDDDDDGNVIVVTPNP